MPSTNEYILRTASLLRKLPKPSGFDLDRHQGHLPPGIWQRLDWDGEGLVSLGLEYPAELQGVPHMCFAPNEFGKEHILIPYWAWVMSYTPDTWQLLRPGYGVSYDTRFSLAMRGLMSRQLLHRTPGLACVEKYRSYVEQKDHHV